jgi:hypothetical protein
MQNYEALMATQLKKRITNTNRAHYALLTLPKGQSVLRAEKIKLSKTLL